MSVRTYLLLATVSLGLVTIVKALQVALTPEAWAVLAQIGTRLMASSGFGFLVALTGIVFCLSLCAAAWERAERRYEAEDRRRLNIRLACEADAAIADLGAVERAIREASLLAKPKMPPNRIEHYGIFGITERDACDNSPSALPETWRAPCGEVVEFPANNDSRGGAA